MTGVSAFGGAAPIPPRPPIPPNLCISYYIIAGFIPPRPPGKLGIPAGIWGIPPPAGAPPAPWPPVIPWAGWLLSRLPVCSPVYSSKIVLDWTFSASYWDCIMGANVAPRGVERNSLGWSTASLVTISSPTRNSPAANEKWLQLCWNTLYLCIDHSCLFSLKNSMKRSSGISVNPIETDLVGLPKGVIPGLSQEIPPP